MRGRGAAAPGTVEPDKSSLWMDLFSLDSGEDTDPPYKVHAFGSRENSPPPPPPPRDRKNLATALLTWLKENLQRPSSLTIRKS